MTMQEYTSENIDWTRVEFEDNQECLELIEKVNFHVANFLKIMLWEVNDGLFGVPAKTTTSLMIQFIFNLSLH